MLEHAADDDALPGKFVGGGSGLFGRQGKLQAVGAQALDNGAVLLVVEEADDAAGHHLADALDLLQLLERGLHQGVHRLEVAGQQAGAGLADKAYAKGKDDAFEGHFLRLLYAVDDALCRLGARAVAVDLLHLDVVQVGHVLDESATVVLVNGLRPQRVDVHGPAGNEVLNAPLDLRRTAGIVGAVPDGLALIAHQRRAALWTAAYELHGLGNDGALVDVDADNLRDNLAALLHVDHVAQVQVERADEVLVVQRGAAHGGACQLHGLHVGHRGDGTGAAHLIGDLQQARLGTLGLELVGNGPAGRLGGIAQRTLLLQRVDFQHDAVGRHRQVFALPVPVVDVVENLLHRAHLAHALADLKAPAASGLQVLIVAIGWQTVA